MAKITLRGNPINTNGDLPAVGSKAPSFALVGIDLADINSTDFAGKRVVLNIFPSIDTPTCAASVREFNSRAAAMDNAAVLCVSRDLPFAMKRFCGTEGLENVTSASAFRSSFASDYGVKMVDGPLAELTARAVVVLDTDGTVLHQQLVGEIGEAPDVDAALKALG